MDVLDAEGKLHENRFHYKPGIRPTSLWEKSFLEDEIIILVDDAKEIVDSLKADIPNLDPVVEQYYLESLRTCQNGFYISSVVFL